MKRLLLLVCLLLTLTLPALADELPAEVSALLKNAHPEHTVTQVVSASDPVIAVMSKEDSHVLCIAEQQGGAWTLTVDNPSALRKGELPSFLWDGDMSLFIRYGNIYTDGYTYIYDYHAQRTADGWSSVDLIAYDTGTGYERAVCYQDGCVYVTVQDYDQDGNPQGSAIVYPPYPQPSLGAKVNLASFDIEAFPTSLEDLSLQEIADNILPGCTVVDGVAGEALSFIADMADGTRRFAGCRWDKAAQCWAVTQSTPLPKGTGCDSFHSAGNYLYVQLPQYGDGYVTVSLEEDGTWQVTFIGGEDWFGIGPCWITDAEGQYHYGAMTLLLDVEQVNWLALPSTLEEAFARLDRAGWAAVNNPDPADRLHLRVSPDRSAQSLGKYYNGTPVQVLKTSGDWVQVDVFGVRGWMMKQYLAFGDAMDTVTPAMPGLFVREELAGGTALYHDAGGSPAGIIDGGVTVMGIVGDKYYHVMEQFNPHVTGYVEQGDLWPGNG